MSDQLTAGFSQKGFTKNFLELMRGVEKKKSCCTPSPIPIVILPNFTPINSDDPTGEIGNFAFDSNYLYVKTTVGWQRTQIFTFPGGG
jgi:hypothetical protein